MRQLGILVFIVLFSVVFVCNCSAGTIVTEKLLSHIGLETAWQSPLALHEGESIKDKWLIGEQLYILTDLNYIFCLESKTGEVLFSFQSAPAGLPVFKPVVNGNMAYIIAGNDLIKINSMTGERLYKGSISFAVSAAPAVNNSFLYIANMNKRLQAMNLQGQSVMFKASADNVTAITSVLADEKQVVFSTNGGNVIGMSPTGPKRLWQFDAVLGITCDVIPRNEAIFASSTDTNIYKIDDRTGKQLWKFHTGSALVDYPRVTDTVVYQFALNKGLYAIDSESGKQLWLLADGVDLLAQDGDNAYVVDKAANCVIMNNKTGQKEFSINFMNASDYIVNTEDSNIYIINKDNLIACIRPKK